MSVFRLIQASALPCIALLAGAAQAAEGRYLLHPTGVSCFIGPCPDWEVTDRQTGEKFVAVGDFSQISGNRPGAADVIAEARKVQRQRPNGGGNYVVLIVTAIISTTPTIPGHQP